MDQRILALLLGCFVGFILGYIVRTLHDLRERVEQVDKHVVEHKDDPDSGKTTPRWVLNAALAFVVILTAYSAFASQNASHDANNNSKRLDNSTSCNQEYLTKTISALNARTAYSSEQNAANVALQEAQIVFLRVLRDSDSTTKNSKDALQAYLGALTKFSEVVNKSSDQVSANPYPKTDNFKDCVGK